MTTEKNLAIYDVASASLAELEKQFAKAPIDVTSKDGFEDCKKTARKFLKLRTGVEATRKQANAEANAHIKKVNGQAKLIQERIAPLEERFAAPINEYKDKFKALVAEVDNLPDVCAGRDSAFIGEKMQWLETVNGDHLYDSKERKDLNASLFTTNEKLNDIFAETIAKEQEEEQRRQFKEKQRIDNCINSMKAEIMDCFGKDAETINQAWKRTYNTIIDESFGDRHEEAETVRSQVMAQLEQMEQQAEQTQAVISDAVSTGFSTGGKHISPEEVYKEPERNLRVEAFEKLIELTEGDYDMANTIRQEIEQGRVPGIVSTY